jgi:hypothetical protein
MPFSKSTKVKMLGNDQNLKWKQTDKGAEIIVPAALQKKGSYVWVLKVLE